ncbi:Transposable element Tc1 transposase [Ceratobasidium sp. AG-Ba]|nr:Transposable element Tc1 transposase [Ceratobasidium sp. AG-Ba]
MFNALPSTSATSGRNVRSSSSLGQSTPATTDPVANALTSFSPEQLTTIFGQIVAINNAVAPQLLPEIWDALKQGYQISHRAVLRAIDGRLVNLRLDEGGNVLGHLLIFKKLLRDLHGTKFEVITEPEIDLHPSHDASCLNARIFRGFKEHRSYKSLARLGRPLGVSPRIKRQVVRTLRINRFKAYKKISETLGDVSLAITGALPAENTKKSWDDKIWTDESILETGVRPGRPKVTRRPGEEDLPSTITPSFRSGRKTLIVFGSIANDRKGPLIRVAPAATNRAGQKRSGAGGMTGEDYVNQVLKGPLLGFYRSMKKERGHEMYLVEDGSGPHRRKSTRAARESLGKDLDSLWAAAKKVWDELTDEEVAAHTSQMDARVKAVKKAKGYQTGF